MYVSPFGPTPFTTADDLPLRKLSDLSSGRLLFAKSLGEWLQEQGRLLVVVSSGSPGLSLVLNPKAPAGVGVTINGHFEGGKVKVGYPESVNQTVLSRFGQPPAQDVPHANLNAAVDWAESVLRDYVLPELKPEVVIDWMSEPDDTQHPKGVGSAEGLAALRNCDRNVGLLLAKLESLGLKDKMDLIVISDHGFVQHTRGVNLKQHLIDAGLKQNPDSDDVVVVPNAQSVLLHVKNHDPERIKRIVRYLQRQDWTDVIFTSASQPTADVSKNKRSVSSPSPYGWLPGTFSLAYIHEANAERGPDILFTLPWNTNLSPLGIAGTSYANSTGKGDEITGDAYGHGGLNPAVVQATMFVWGVDFKRSVTETAPSANVDILPTILRLEDIPIDANLEGRVLEEAFVRTTNRKTAPVKPRLIKIRPVNGYQAIIEISEHDGHTYLDSAWRVIR